MTARARRPWAVAAAVLAALAMVVGPSDAPAAAKTGDKIEKLQKEQRELEKQQKELESERDEAKAEQEAINEDLQAITARLDDLEAEIAVVQERIDTGAREVEMIADDLVAQRELAGDRIRQMYKAGASDPLLRLMAGESTQDVLEQTHYLSAISEQDRETVEAMAATATKLERRQADLDEDRRQMATMQVLLQDMNAELETRLAEAVEVEKRVAEAVEKTIGERRELAAEERTLRQQQAAVSRAGRFVGGSGSGPVSAGGKACPQAQPRAFTDTWGAPRSGGRRHKGTDIMGARGGNVYAIASGSIQFTKTGRTSGLFLSLRGDDGHVYWYMHLQDFVVRPGQRVQAGQLIAHNGDTGNARGTSPHIHFEYHPGGGGPVNPYPLLRAVCG